MLEVENVTFQYKKRHGGFSLKQVGFSLENGYFCCLLGPNGSGKTTLLKLICGMLLPESGSITFDGQRLSRESLEAWRGQIACAGVTNWCLTEKSVTENLRLLAPLYERFDERMFLGLLHEFGWREKGILQRPAGSLSTGRAMQLQIAFALARKPKLLLLDEPLANLDPVAKTQLLEVLHERVTLYGMSVIVSTHLAGELSDMTDYAAVLTQGRLQGYGDREEILAAYQAESLREVAAAKGAQR